MLETPTVRKVGNNTYAAEFGSDQNLYVRFYEDALRNQFRSDEEGIESFDQFIFVEVITAGSKTVHVEKIAVYNADEKVWHYFNSTNGVPKWQDRFPEQWKQFQSSQEQTVEGYPVTECPFFNKAYALNLKSRHIHTLEQIRDLPDQNLDALGLGARDIREKVRSFLNKAGDASQITKLFAEIERLKADNVAMKEMLEGATSPEVQPPLKLKKTHAA